MFHLRYLFHYTWNARKGRGYLKYYNKFWKILRHSHWQAIHVLTVRLLFYSQSLNSVDNLNKTQEVRCTRLETHGQPKDHSTGSSSKSQGKSRLNGQRNGLETAHESFKVTFQETAWEWPNLFRFMRQWMLTFDLSQTKEICKNAKYLKAGVVHFTLLSLP